MYMEKNKNIVAFLSTDKEQIADLYNFLAHKGFNVCLNTEKMSITNTVMYTISTIESDQKLLKGFAIQYAGYNALNNILIIDKNGNAKSISSLSTQLSPTIR